MAIGLPAFGQVNLFGEVGDLWGEGYEAEEADDFEAALDFYYEAMAASETLADPHLQECAWSGSVARAVSMEIAIEYLAEVGISPASLEEAHEVADYAHRAAFEELDEQYPHLANSCP